MTNQYQPLVCDKCGRPIEKPEEGMLEFISDVESGNCSGFQVIHDLSSSPLSGGCGYQEGQLSLSGKVVGDDALNYYTGPHIQAKLDLLKDTLDIANDSEIEEIKAKLLRAGYGEYQNENDYLN